MDENEAEFPPSANGIVQCLRLLAAEAASLNLARTLSAIEDALHAAACESGGEAALTAAPAQVVLH